MNYDISNPALAEAGARRVEWAGRRMQVLATVRERFAKEKPLDGLVVAACLHVTAETANLMLALRDGGAEPLLCASKPAVDPGRCRRGPRRRGHPGVRHPRRGRRHLLQAHPRRSRPRSCDHDGRRRRPGHAAPHRSAGTSKSSAPPRRRPPGSSVSRRWQLTEPFASPVVAVNDSATKHLFDNHYGTGQSAIDGIIRATNILLAGQNMVVIGYGDCGRGVAKRPMGLEPSVIVVEIDPSAPRRRRWTGTR